VIFGRDLGVTRSWGQAWFFVFRWHPVFEFLILSPMPRRLRIEFEDAIYHVMARGNARQDIVHDDDDRRRLVAGLERVVVRTGWQVLSFVLLSNHFHLMVKTPRPNLASGMQVLLSSYAHWVLRRRRRIGHLFQGRYKAEMIEDESYYWIVSRYIHLNPVRAGLVTRPEHWAWSSYPGYTASAKRRDWVAYDTLLSAWQGEYGGTDPGSAYVGFVEAGVHEPPVSPFRNAFSGWILGSSQFVERLRTTAGPVVSDPPAPEARQLAGLDPDQICAAVTSYYGVDLELLSRRSDPHIARGVAAWLCRRHSEISLRELAPRLGLSRADSVPNLTRRIDAKLAESPRFADELDQIMRHVRSRPEAANGQVQAGGRAGRLGVKVVSKTKNQA
jgi:putative transposase